MHLGIAHHFGWAVAVTVDRDAALVDRRRIELVEPGVAVAPIHSEGKTLDDAGAAALVAEVRASAARATGAALDALAAAIGAPIATISLREWDPDFPTDLLTLRRVPYEARADSVMYREVLAEEAAARGSSVVLFDARTVEADTREVLGPGADQVLRAPRDQIGPPWGKDQRVAYAAAILAGTRTLGGAQR